MSKFAVILLAAGQSRRFKDNHYKKPFVPLANRAVWLHSAERFVNRPDVSQVILAISPEDREDFQMKFASNVMILGIDVVEGGRERSDSVEAALKKVKPEIDFIAVHDAARPCLADIWIDELFAKAEKTGAAILARPVDATLKRSSGDKKTISETLDRRDTWEAQTPQVFAREMLLDAYAARGDFKPTDDAQMVEHHGKAKISLVRCSRMNFKITTREDLRLAEATLKVLPKPKLDRPAHPFADDIF
jgi:2-C-methyl-D-erythritol 4-phosphate cytidylyltransferase